MTKNNSINQTSHSGSFDASIFTVLFLNISGQYGAEFCGGSAPCIVPTRLSHTVPAHRYVKAVWRDRSIIMLRLRQNGCRFAGSIFKLIFLYEIFVCILMQISVELVPKDSIDSKPAHWICIHLKAVTWTYDGEDLWCHMRVTWPKWVKYDGVFRCCSQQGGEQLAVWPGFLAAEERRTADWWGISAAGCGVT